MLIFQPLPYYDPTYTNTVINYYNKTELVIVEYRISTVLLSLMFMRILMITRAVFNYSMYTDQHAKKLM
jgi:hypothetical protein